MNDLNHMVWRGAAHSGHYEGWYLTLVDPKTGCGFWFRYTILVPGDGRTATASLWAFSFDPNGMNEKSSAGRSYGPLSSFSEAHKPWSISLRPGHFLNEKKACGKVSTEKGLLSWDLDLGPSTESWEHFNPRLFQIGLSSTCVNSPRLAMPISGTISLGAKTWKLKDAPGEQSHIWGRKPTNYYAWAHCNAFDNGEDGLFEGVNARIQKGALRLPAAGPLLFRSEDHSFEVKGFIPMFQVTSQHEYGRWAFEAESSRQLLRGEVSVEPKNVVAVEYDDPRGDGKVICHNSIVADMNLALYERRSARWEKVLSRQSTGTTSFEITRQSIDPNVERRLHLTDAQRLED
ncbi:MAG: tocopherol cyclase family protein [Planctomycetota bacterium]|nr:tocopherol cyclase family protein [Planctomycetota bacterium]